jgi:hypothetical protein
MFTSENAQWPGAHSSLYSVLALFLPHLEWSGNTMMFQPLANWVLGRGSARQSQPRSRSRAATPRARLSVEALEGRFLLSTSPANPAIVVDGTSQSLAYQFSPDGKYLAFVAHDNNKAKLVELPQFSPPPPPALPSLPRNPTSIG